MPTKKAIANITFGLAIFGTIAWAGWWLGENLDQQLVLGLDRAGILLGYFLACLTSATGMVALLNSRAILRILKRLRGGYVNTGLDFQVPVERIEAMVIPVSRKVQPEWIICHLQPKHVSFIYTADENSRNAALELATKYARANDDIPHAVQFFPDEKAIRNGEHMVLDPDNPLKSKLLAKTYLRRFIENGISRQKIFVDTTGGKVPMSIGCFQAAEEMRVSSIYVRGTRRQGKIGDAKRKADGDPVFMSDHSV